MAPAVHYCTEANAPPCLSCVHPCEASLEVDFATDMKWTKFQWLASCDVKRMGMATRSPLPFGEIEWLCLCSYSTNSFFILGTSWDMLFPQLARPVF